MIIFLLPKYKGLSLEKNDYIIKQLKVKDGLSQSSILCILQDKLGFMWFGTASGLNKYDGYTFKIYLNDPADSSSISDNGISAIFEDKDGFIWVGTSSGVLNKFDRRTDTFKRLSIDMSMGPPGKVNDNYYEFPLLFSRNSDNSITSISEDHEGNIWIGTWGKGIFIMNKNMKSLFNLSNDQHDPKSLSSNRVTKILFDSHKNMWVATFGGGLNKVIFNRSQNDSNKSIYFQHYKNISTDIKSLSDNNVITLFEDNNGSLWIGTFYGGLNNFEYEKLGSSSEAVGFIHYNKSEDNQNSLSANSIMAVSQDNSGYLWIGTFGGGLNRFDPQTKNFIYFRHDNLDENTVADNDITTIYKDNSGIIWIGTQLGEGISRLERRNIKFDLIKSDPRTSSSLSDDVVWSILKDIEGVLWIGTYRGGLNRYDEKKKIFYHYKNNPLNPNSLSNNHVRSLAEDENGMLWVGTYAGGLNKLDKHSGKFIRYINSASDSLSITGNQIQKLYIDSNSVMWIAVFGGGLNVLDLKNESHSKASFTKYRFDPNDPQSISDDRAYTVYEDREKNIWIGTYGGGLNKFNKKNKTFERFRNNPQNPFSLQNDKVLCLYEDYSRNFWVGTAGDGLIKFDRKNNKFMRYGTQKNINADMVYGILEDDNKNLWLSTSNGIYKFSYETEVVSHYDLQDGVQSLEFSGGAYYKASDGEMFFGGIKGINHFFPNKVKDNSFIPPIVITSIKVANQFVKGETDSLTLSYQENFLTFEFATLAYSDPFDNYYSYMLEGFDDDWKFTDAKYRVANYTNLPSGKYIFKVKGANPDGIWNPKETKIFIQISPPVWRTWWFNVLAILLISSGIYYLGTMRSRNELAIEKLKTKLAADLHDNIGSGLTEISILSELAKKETDRSSNQNIHAKLKIISEAARQLVDNMSDIVWVVNPKRDSLHDLLVRLKDSYSDILSSYGISFKIINLDKISSLTLPMEYRQNLYLIFKEGINNAIKHSKCKKITLESNVRDNVIEIILMDDGVGLNNGKLDYGNGIRNMEERSKTIGGSLKWNSAPDNGTTIKFIGKIKNTGFFNKFFYSN